jgi:hypothetical protein
MTKSISQDLKDALVTLKRELSLIPSSGKRAIIQVDANDVTLIVSDTWIFSEDILKLVKKETKECEILLKCEDVSSLKVTLTREFAIAAAKEQLDPEIFEALGL